MKEGMAVMSMRETIGAFIMAPKVQHLITVLIVLNAITLGLETSPTVMAEWGPILIVLDRAVLAVFVIEIAAKLVHKGFGFFKEGWNVFDFLVVGIALVPAAGPLSVLRALRILRTLRLLSVVPQMRVVVQALFTAMPAMASIIALISLIFYVGAVLATNLFGAGFEDWFGDIGRSMYTLFQIMTLESWSMGIVRPVQEIYPYAWAFFVPFIMITTFAVVNLLVGLIVNSMQDAHSEEEHAQTDAYRDEVLDRLKAIEARLDRQG